jgi:hypothetical protein
VHNLPTKQPLSLAMPAARSPHWVVHQPPTYAPQLPHVRQCIDVPVPPCISPRSLVGDVPQCLTGQRFSIERGARATRTLNGRVILWQTGQTNGQVSNTQRASCCRLTHHRLATCARPGGTIAADVLSGLLPWPRAGYMCCQLAWACSVVIHGHSSSLSV